MKKVLFCTPTGGRTGSEMMLLYLMQALGETVQPSVYTRQGKGEIFESYPVFSMPKRGDFLGPLYEGIYFKLFKKSSESAWITSLQKKCTFDLWYLNTIQMHQLAPLAVELGIPYWVHVHELVSVYEEIPFKNFEFLLKHATKIIACSKAVQDRLQEMGYANSTLLYEGVITSHIAPSGKIDVRKELNIPSDLYLWVMSGTTNLRKGYDLIPEVLAHLPKNHGILWVGGDSKTGLGHYVKSSCQQAGLFFFQVGPQVDLYYDYLDAGQGFVLMSREDPFPLVMQEAAYLGKCILGFSSGGINEFVLPSFGEVVEGIQPKRLAEVMTAWSKRSDFGEFARQRALDFDVNQRKSEFQALFQS